MNKDIIIRVYFITLLLLQHQQGEKRREIDIFKGCIIE